MPLRTRPTAVAATLLLIVLLGSRSIEAFTGVKPNSNAREAKALFYVSDKVDTAVAQTEPTSQKATTATIDTKKKKPTIYPISSLQELYDFLQEDDRLTAIKFYAPWCKYCRQVGLHYQGMAMELGDGVVARQAVTGQIRCAAIEYGSMTAKLITEQLQIQGVPTLQLYKGTTKVWQSKCTNAGHPNKTNKIKTCDLKREIQRLLAMPPKELDAYVADLEDDGILEEAMEESFFDNSECHW